MLSLLKLLFPEKNPFAILRGHHIKIDTEVNMIRFRFLGSADQERQKINSVAKEYVCENFAEIVSAYRKARLSNSTEALKYILKFSTVFNLENGKNPFWTELSREISEDLNSAPAAEKHDFFSAAWLYLVDKSEAQSFLQQNSAVIGPMVASGTFMPVILHRRIESEGDVQGNLDNIKLYEPYIFSYLKSETPRASKSYFVGVTIKLYQQAKEDVPEYLVTAARKYRRECYRTF